MWYLETPKNLSEAIENGMKESVKYPSTTQDNIHAHVKSYLAEQFSITIQKRGYEKLLQKLFLDCVRKQNDHKRQTRFLRWLKKEKI